MIAKRLKMLGVGADIGVTLVLQVLSAVASFAFQAVILRSLDKSDSGIYFLAITYITLATGLADFGFVATVTPRLSVARGAATHAFKTALLMRSLTVLLGWILLNIYLLVAAKHDLLLFVNIAYASVIFSSKATGIRQLFELLWRLRGRTYVVTAISVIDIMLGLLVIGVLAYMGELTLLRVLLIFTLSNVPGFIAILLPLISRLRDSGIFRSRTPMRYYRTLLFTSLPVAMMIVLGQASGQLETLVIESYTAMSHADIANYNAGIRPLMGVLFIATTFGFGLVPIVAQYNKGARSDYSSDFIISVGLRTLGVIALCVCAGSLLFAEDVMRLFGKDYTGEGYILRIYSVINGLIFFVVMLDQFLLALGRRKQTLYGAILYFVLALLLEPFAIRAWGIRGMMFAKALAACCLIAFQLSRFDRSMRRAGALALLRVLPSGICLFGVYFLTEGLAIVPRVALVLASLGGGILATRLVKISELKALRAMRVA